MNGSQVWLLPLARANCPASCGDLVVLLLGRRWGFCVVQLHERVLVDHEAIQEWILLAHVLLQADDRLAPIIILPISDSQR